METARLAGYLSEHTVRFEAIERDLCIRKLHGKGLKSMLQGHLILMYPVQQAQNSKKG